MKSQTFFHLVTPRILTALLSLAIFSILATQLGRYGFAQFQVPFTLGSILLWLADLGLLRSSLKSLAENNIPEASDAWFLRLILLVISSLSLISINLYFSKNIEFSGIIIVGLIDAASDAVILLHQESLRSRFHIYDLVAKKLTQVCLLSLMTLIIGSDDVTIISISILIPASSHLLLESRYFSLRKFSISKTLNKSLKFWTSAGGNYLANFDNYIISLRDGSSLILVIAAGRKIGNAILLFSQSINSKIFFSTARYKTLTYSGYRIAYASFFLTASFSIVVAFFHSQIFQLFTGTDVSGSETLLFYSILLSVNLSCISGILNSILNGFGQFKYSNISSYVSTGAYIICLYSLPEIFSIYVIIAIAIVINHFIELSLLSLGFWKLKLTFFSSQERAK